MSVKAAIYDRADLILPLWVVIRSCRAYSSYGETIPRY
jgi:hypothetical protein